MAIPERQLETWTSQGSVTQSSNTYNTIKRVLEDQSTPYFGKKYSVFLQGSYGNDTNIYAESDVDIVIQLDDCWQSDLSRISDEEKTAYRNAYVDATYTHRDFKRDVLKVLSDVYGNDVKAGDKAIAIAASGNRRKADVIAAIQFRRYYKFRGIYDQNFTPGMCFYNATGEQIANYPKDHSENLTRKHQSTGNLLKLTTRMFKNLRGKLVDDGKLKAGVAPSYFIEGLLYNVPDSKFSNNRQDTFAACMRWLQDDADKSKLLCANEQYYLLWDNSHTAWPKANYETFLSAATDLWNNWT